MENKSLVELSAQLQSKALSSVALTEHYLSQIEQQQALNSFITVTAEQALATAKLADQALANGNAHPLTGIPVAHKDLFCTDGVKTSCGSKYLDNFVAPYNATVVQKFADLHMPMLGKTNMDEFGMGSTNERSHYGACLNPWNTECVAGGSSGGSAVAVAAGLAPLATGSDTGGSIRQPASFNGITGIKPTYGRVSRWGMVAYASSLDQGGVMAQSAEDCALALSALAGFDDKDSTSMDLPVDDYMAALPVDIKGLRIGIPKEYFADGLDPAVDASIKQALSLYESLGAELVEVSLPNTHLAIPAYYVIAPAEASANLSRFDGVRYGYRCDDPVDLEDLYKRSRSESFGAEVQRRIMIGTYALSAGYYDAYYIKAQKIRRLVSDDFSRAFESVDLIAGPTAPKTAYQLDEMSHDPVSMYLSDIYTIAVNLSGLPGMSLPVAPVNGMPVGLQLIGPSFAEARLLNAAHQFQQASDWHLKQPS